MDGPLPVPRHMSPHAAPSPHRPRQPRAAPRRGGEDPVRAAPAALAPGWRGASAAGSPAAGGTRRGEPGAQLEARGTGATNSPLCRIGAAKWALNTMHAFPTPVK